ncbi:MAG TPA: hypothetical protein VLF93_00805 [Candidatus Saccharimonadales bacterium]|nr:hypothetical protein [Candidatus Saccharimonadales bacterium]
MSDIDDKHFEHLAKMKSLQGMSHWYSWDSPIGLSIFFFTLAFIVVLIKVTFWG